MTECDGQIDESLTNMAQPVPRPDATTRREFAGMITHLDEAIQDIASTMETAGLWCDAWVMPEQHLLFKSVNVSECVSRENTLLFACSDNGGDISSGASNFPYSGGTPCAYILSQYKIQLSTVDIPGASKVLLCFCRQVLATRRR